MSWHRAWCCCKTDPDEEHDAECCQCGGERGAGSLTEGCCYETETPHAATGTLKELFVEFFSVGHKDFSNCPGVKKWDDLGLGDVRRDVKWITHIDHPRSWYPDNIDMIHIAGCGEFRNTDREIQAFFPDFADTLPLDTFTVTAGMICGGQYEGHWRVSVTPRGGQAIRFPDLRSVLPEFPRPVPFVPRRGIQWCDRDSKFPPRIDGWDDHDCNGGRLDIQYGGFVGNRPGNIFIFRMKADFTVTHNECCRDTTDNDLCKPIGTPNDDGSCP